jgi:YebC/PmpR family DNA-binding regulatory protein
MVWFIEWQAMSGHSKWHSIKHKKGAADAKRGKLFSKLARAITVAARDGGGDVDHNPTLATAVQKAKDASMPKDKIQKAIDVGTGAGSDGAAIERVLYEGYGPAGVAVLVEALTDNRNRASAEIRHAFSKHGGNLGEPGSVAWIFEKKGAIVVDGGRYGEDDLIGAIDAGAEDVQVDEDKLRVICDPASLTAVKESLEGEGIEIESAGLAVEPKSTVELKGHDAERVLKLLDALDEQDDVDEVFANFDIPADVLEQLAA